MVVKKYSTRRLYDTDESRYVKLEDLAEAVKAGRELQVVDAQSGEDLTQGILLQLFVERDASAKLPSGVLARMLRLDEESLAEFLATWVGSSLASYLEMKERAGAVAAGNEDGAPVVPAAPAATGAEAAALSPDEWAETEGSSAGSRVRTRADASTDERVDALRQEVEELKDLIRQAAGKRDSA
jgi:polyhydroxyalkanoate synthesis repressor PhaR